LQRSVSDKESGVTVRQHRLRIGSHLEVLAFRAEEEFRQ
jgi:hypothetical protein